MTLWSSSGQRAGPGCELSRPMDSRPHPEHKVYPCVLRGLSITRPYQVSSTGVTY